jgi:hypothetical protein
MVLSNLNNKIKKIHFGYKEKRKIVMEGIE